MYMYMFLCCVKSFVLFRSNLEFYKFFKLLKNMAKVPDCILVHDLKSNFVKNDKDNSPFLLHFLMHMYMVLCYYYFLVISLRGPTVLR